MTELPLSPASRSVYVCQRCTACCKWPGNVRLDDADISAISAFLDMKEADFIEKFTRIHTDRKSLSLIEKENDECIFLEAGGCFINPVKPQQCRDFPNKWNFPGWRDHCKAVLQELPKDDAS